MTTPKSSYFIFHLSETGSNGTYNISKIEGQNINGYKTKKEAREALIILSSLYYGLEVNDEMMIMEIFEVKKKNIN